MENEENEVEKEQSVGNQIAEQGKEFAKQEAEQVAKQAINKGTKAATSAIKKGIASFIAPALPIIIPIIVIIVLVIVLYVIKDQIMEVITNVATSIVNFITIGENGPEAPNPQEMIDLINNSLKEQGIDKESLGLGIATDTYLYKYMAASLSTQLPYIKDSTAETLKEIAVKVTLGTWVDLVPKRTEVQGIVKIKRQSSTGKKDLKYTKYEDFKEMIDNNNKEALNRFAIDQNWMLCVAKVTTTKTNNEAEINTLTEEKIPYQTMISKYSVPFEFFISLLQITQNPEYVSAVAELVQDQGEIEFTIFDSTETIVTTTTTQYKNRKKWIEEKNIAQNGSGGVRKEVYGKTAQEVTDALNKLIQRIR